MGEAGDLFHGVHAAAAIIDMGEKDEGDVRVDRAGDRVGRDEAQLVLVAE